MTISNLVLDLKSDISVQRYRKYSRINEKFSHLRMLYFQILVQILVDFDKLYQNLFKNSQFGILFSFWSTLKTLIFQRLAHKFLNIFAYESRIFHPRPDLKGSLNSPIMIKANQHMFLNKILFKIANLSENPDYKSLKIVL